MAANGTRSGGAFRPLETKDLLAALPVAHLLACALFIYGYCRTFGDHIIALVSLGDIFAISVREMGIVYAALLLPLSLRVATGAPGTRPNGSAAEAATSRARLYVNWFCIAAVFVSLVALLFAKDLATAAGPQVATRVTLGLLLALSAAEWALVWATRRLPLSSFDVRAVGATLLVCACLQYGVHKGLLDKYRDHGPSVDKYLNCDGGGLLVRRLGGYDIVLMEGGGQGPAHYRVGSGICAAASNTPQAPRAAALDAASAEAADR